MWGFTSLYWEQRKADMEIFQSIQGPVNLERSKWMPQVSKLAEQLAKVDCIGLTGEGMGIVLWKSNLP